MRCCRVSQLYHPTVKYVGGYRGQLVKQTVFVTLTSCAEQEQTLYLLLLTRVYRMIPT